MISRLFTLGLMILLPVGLVSLIGSPWLTGVVMSSLILMVMVVGLYLFCGNSGVLAFGHVSFVAIGAYTCGLLTVPAKVKPAIFPNIPTLLADISVPPHVGVLIGFATVVAQILLPQAVSPFRDAFVFAAVILVLLFRPQGLFVAFGRSVRA